jgi:tetratricopeptide (TPR) repeat protein
VEDTVGFLERLRPWTWLGLFVSLFSPAGAEAHQGLSVELARLNEKVAVRPYDLELLLDRSALHRRRGDSAAALADLEQIALLAPTNRRLKVERGLVFFALKDLVQAERELDLFLATGPGSVEALWTRAKLREDTGRPGQAIEDYNAALRLDPSPDLYLARGRLHEARGELAIAAQGYEEGLRRLGGAVALRLALLRVEEQLGRPERAIALIDEVLPGLQVKAEWLLKRAQACAAAGNLGAARQDREAALEELNALLRERPSALWQVSRASAYLALGREAEAVAELERVTRLAPRLDEAQALLHQARERLRATRSGAAAGRKPR